MPEPPVGDRAAFVVESFGDAALLVTLGDRVDPVLAAAAQRVAADLDAFAPTHAGFGRAVPAHASVLLPFDPMAIDVDAATALVRRCLAAPGSGLADVAVSPVPVEIPVRYGGSDGPDLAEVADLHGLTPVDLIDAHASATYRVLFLGFAPGFAYLGGLPAALATARRATPRERVPAGSVGIAGGQTGIYPLAMPGGWQLIGRTDARMFDTARAEPALLRPGASVRFVPLR